MRFEFTLTLNNLDSANILPQSYLFEISEWLRSSFKKHEQVFNNWLMENGLEGDITKFNGYCYSRLFIPASYIQRDRLIVESQNVKLQISFLPEIETEEMVRELFANQEAVIGDFLTQAAFHVSHIQLMEVPNLSSCKFKTLSPLYVSILREDGSLMSISPETQNFGGLLLKNLQEKYQIFYKTPFRGEQTHSFQLLESSHSSSVIVNAGLKSEAKLRGFDTSFLFEADHELLKIAYNSGFGENNSIGFGMVENI